MTRAEWKGPYLNTTYLGSWNISKKQHICTANRNSKIIPQFLGLTFNISNGKNFTKLTVIEPMLGHKFGEFAFTRTEFSFKKKKSKK